MDMINFGGLAKNALEEALRERGHANVLIAGRTGVGKSTLINSVFQGNPPRRFSIAAAPGCDLRNIAIHVAYAMHQQVVWAFDVVGIVPKLNEVAP
ncbi:GTPase [Anatilimnocola floriformis]|uniref:GTPase n=1 Tax=Anatilimnocola floriformis TaxID=2948575 RepID=UPI0020C4FB4D|nr:GTPase [Anatilimnocola floriformis]